MVNMYLDITEKLEKTIEKINDILQLTNTRGLLITMDSNSRSRTWHDKLTNSRGKKLKKFLISKQLFVMNEDSEMTTFQSTRGSSNIDLTISNNKLLKEMQDWKTVEEESCSDHKIIQFYIGQYDAHQTGSDFQNIKYVVREENRRKFETLITQEMAKQMCGSRRREDNRILDKHISLQIANTEDMEDIVSKFSDTLTAACDKSFKKARTHMQTNRHKTVPWWTEELTIARKRVNAFKRKYQRTKNNNIREQRKTKYQAEKAQYQTKIKNAKRSRGNNTVTILYPQTHGT